MSKTITTMFGITVFAAILFSSAVLAPQAFAGEKPNEAGKVTICHNGDKGSETIKVSGNAVQKHIDKHGDTIGECMIESSTCEQCLITNNEALEVCEDAQCSIEALQNLSECSLTCTGDTSDPAVIPQACWNETAPSLDVCIESVATNDGVLSCIFALNAALNSCSSTG